MFRKLKIFPFLLKHGRSTLNFYITFQQNSITYLFHRNSAHFFLVLSLSKKREILNKTKLMHAKGKLVFGRNWTKTRVSRYKDSVSAIFSIFDLLQPRAEVKNAEQHGRSSFNTPAQFIINTFFY